VLLNFEEDQSGNTIENRMEEGVKIYSPDQSEIVQCQHKERKTQEGEADGVNPPDRPHRGRPSLFGAWRHPSSQLSIRQSDFTDTPGRFRQRKMDRRFSRRFAEACENRAGKTRMKSDPKIELDRSG
jgi:hypothetical protein